MSVTEENFYTAMMPLKCHTQWMEKHFCQSNYERNMRLWNFAILFLWRSRLTTTLWSWCVDIKPDKCRTLNTSSIITIILCTKIIVNIKHGFPSCCCWFFNFLVELYHLHNFSKYKSVINKYVDKNVSFLALKQFFTFCMNIRNHLLRDICKMKVHIFLLQ